MVRVYIITEVRSYRDALARSLNGGPVEVVGTAPHPLQAVNEMQALRPDVTLLDLPGPMGPVWARELAASCPRTQMLAFGIGEAEHEVVAWAEAGVAGYVGRDASLEEVTAAVDGAARGEASCHPRTAAILLRRMARGESDMGPAWQCDRHLTAREREVVQLLGEGLSNQQMARRLCIALPTVKNHVHNILEKLGVGRREDAVREVRRGGFLAHGQDPPPGGSGQPPGGGSVLPFVPRNPQEPLALDGPPEQSRSLRQEALE